MVLAFEEVLPTVYCMYDPSSKNLYRFNRKTQQQLLFLSLNGRHIGALPEGHNKASPYLKNYTLSDLNLGLARFLLVNANETSIAGSQKALTHSLDFVKYFIYGNYNVPYYNAADQCIRLSPW